MDTRGVMRAAAVGAAVVIVGGFLGVVIGVLSMCSGDGPEFPY